MDTPLSPNDDPDLLDLMMQDMGAADPQYRPGNYWEVYARRFLPELKNVGLRDFRRRRGSVVHSFAGTDLVHPVVWFDQDRLRFINNRYFRRIPGWPGLMGRLAKCVEAGIRTTSYCSQDARKALISALCRSMAAEVPNAKPLSDFSMSLIGNPEEVFDIDGKKYSTQFFENYLHYVYVSRFLNLDTVQVVAELGAGMGRQIELLRKLHPHLSFYIFDIAPQLYVSERYLSSVFPGSVTSYRETREWTRLPDPEPGRIYFLGSWKMPLLEQRPIDLFWSTDSFQEMEPESSANYLRLASASARNVYLRQGARGQSVAARPGAHGVMKATPFDHYRNCLAAFEEIDFRPNITTDGTVDPDYCCAFWRRPNA